MLHQAPSSAQTNARGLCYAQTGMPMTGLAVMGAQFRLAPHDRVLLQQQFLPWALRAGNNCHDLMSIYYEHHLQVGRPVVPELCLPGVVLHHRRLMGGSARGQL